jgi:hypothetical protein
MYLSKNYGAPKIAITLNEQGERTKRGKYWSNNAIIRILRNEIYTGKIINGKQEVINFLSSEREEKSEDEWYVRDYPEIRIITDSIFEETQELLRSRSEDYKIYNRSQRSKYLFSTLIKCGKCGRSFRYIKKKTANYYVCYNRNEHTSSMCDNMTQIYEEDLKSFILNYFKEFCTKKENLIARSATEIKKVYDSDMEMQTEVAELEEQLTKLKQARELEADMYRAGLYTIDELKKNTDAIVAEIKKLEACMQTYTYGNYTVSDFEKMLRKSFKTIEDFLQQGEFTNESLKKVISSIDAYEDGRVVIHIKPFEDIGLSEVVRFAYDGT